MVRLLNGAESTVEVGKLKISIMSITEVIPLPPKICIPLKVLAW